MLERLVSAALAFMSGAPAPLVYCLGAVWLGLESAGIGVPIEPMLLLMGSLASVKSAQGVNPVLATVAVSAGCVLFSLLAYTLGRSGGVAAITRVGRYVGLTPARATHIELWLRRRGALGVFIARLTPLVRTYGSYIMGAAEIPLPIFLSATFLGALVYCGVFIGLGDALGANYKAPLVYVDAIGTKGVVFVAVGALLLVALHHVWGRLGMRHMALHFHRHAPAPLPVAVAADERL